jgi:DNA-binding response OmpR family regulator
MSATEPTDAGFSILIVEDNRTLADSLAMYLRIATGFDVRVAADGAAGVESALRNPPDVIICDINLPKKDGFAVAEEVGRALPRKPLLLALTAYADVADRLFQAGYNHYFVKPADPTEIHTVISMYEHRLRSQAL